MPTVQLPMSPCPSPPITIILLSISALLTILNASNKGNQVEFLLW